MSRTLTGWLRVLTLLPLLAPAAAIAEPYLAVETGLKCSACHVNPTGGGLRTAFGDTFAQYALPAHHIATGADTWDGALGAFLRLGGDLRTDASATQVPHTQTTGEFDLEQSRIYLAATPIPDRLLVYADEQIAPGGALNREAYALYWSTTHSWYVKAGQMYLPFGLRLQDQSAFVLQASDINMTTPDRGVEMGWLGGPWDAQLTVSNGTAAGTVTDSRKQYGAQLSFVQALWRLGLAANYNDKAAGSRSASGIFGGLRTGPVQWLGQVDLIEDKSLRPAVRTAAALLEADIRLARGHNLKLTGESLDPNRGIHNNGQTRWSVVYELTPVQFLQIRTGLRYADGIPQNDAQHTRLYFIELHGFF
jgi:hypothetical protein